MQKFKANEIVVPNRENFWFCVDTVPAVFEYTVDRVHWNRWPEDITEHNNNVTGMILGCSCRINSDWVMTSK